MRSRILVLALAAFACACPAFATDRAKLDRLMEIFHVRELSAKAIQSMLSGEGAMMMSAQQRSCMSRVFTVDAFTDEMRGHYASLFSDEAVADQTIAYFSTPAGKRLLDAVLGGATSAQLATVVRGFTAEEVKAMEQFTASPAGAQFQTMGSRLRPLQEASTRRLVQKATTRCGLPTREQR